MDSTPTQVYEDFVPSTKLVQEEHSNTIHLTLPGFKKEQLRIQLTKTGILIISGQRPIGQNKLQRFQKEFHVAENCDKSKISAKFENDILHVKLPKLIASTVKKDDELATKEAENTLAAKIQTTTSRDEFSKQDNADISTSAKEEPKNDCPKTGEQTEAKSLAENKLPADGSSSISSSSGESESESTMEYEIFVPSSELVQEQHSDTILLNLPGFSMEQLRVQLTQTGILNISGHRQIGQHKWQGFCKEFAIAENCDKSKIRAKFEKGILHVKQPKMITSAAEMDNELAATGAENNPAANKVGPKNNSSKTGEKTEAKSPAEKSPADETSSSRSSYSESTDDETTGNVSCLDANLKKPRRMIKMTLVGLSVLGIALYVANVMKSANGTGE